MMTAYSTLDKKPIIAEKLISISYTNAANARGNTKKLQFDWKLSLSQ